jgi:uncharacterized membrane protein YidH (DUF202 family)
MEDDPRLRTDLAFIRTSLASFGMGLVLIQVHNTTWARPAAILSFVLAILFAYRGRRGFWAS